MANNRAWIIELLLLKTNVKIEINKQKEIYFLKMSTNIFMMDFVYRKAVRMGGGGGGVVLKGGFVNLAWNF